MYCQSKFATNKEIKGSRCPGRVPPVQKGALFLPHTDLGRETQTGNGNCVSFARNVDGCWYFCGCVSPKCLIFTLSLEIVLFRSKRNKIRVRSEFYWVFEDQRDELSHKITNQETLPVGRRTFKVRQEVKNLRVSVSSLTQHVSSGLGTFNCVLQV